VRIIVCNDAYVSGVNNWQTVESLATSMGVECVTRQVRGGAKAGNIENARQSVKACGNSLLAILDADQVAEPEFLERTVAPFGDPDVGWVQTRQYYRNDNCLVSRLAESQASLFYDWVCPGKAATNASYICGTNVVIRASVLDQIGGMPTESVTEDFAASIRSHQSWRSVYLRETLAKGLGPLDLTGYFVQQGRWARGTMGVIRTDWKRLVRSGVGEMSGNQRLQYFLSGTHYLCGVRDFVFLSTALVSLYLSESPIQHVEPYVIFGFLLPYIFASQALLLLQSRKSSIVGGMVIGYISFPVLIASFIEAITNRKMRFHVTPKSVSTSSDLPAIVPHLLIVVICTFVLVHALLTHTAFTRTDAIPLFWVTYALCIILPTFFIAKLRPAH
jgi:cellulose synthase (UDP-forming)